MEHHNQAPADLDTSNVIQGQSLSDISMEEDIVLYIRIRKEMVYSWSNAKILRISTKYSF